MRLIDGTIKYTSQARPGRASAGAVFIFPWHADIMDVLDTRRNIGQEELRTRNLFNSLVIPDLLSVFTQHISAGLFLTRSFLTRSVCALSKQMTRGTCSIPRMRLSFKTASAKTSTQRMPCLYKADGVCLVCQRVSYGTAS